MKKLFFCLIVLNFTFAFSQNVDLTSKNNKLLLFSHFYALYSIPKSINYQPNQTLNIYNPTTQLTDSYSQSGDDFYQTNSKFEVMGMNDNSQKDSLSPNGTKDFGSAIVFGFMNLLFGKN